MFPAGLPSQRAWSSLPCLTSEGLVPFLSIDSSSVRILTGKPSSAIRVAWVRLLPQHQPAVAALSLHQRRSGSAGRTGHPASVGARLGLDVLQAAAGELFLPIGSEELGELGEVLLLNQERGFDASTAAWTGGDGCGDVGLVAPLLQPFDARHIGLVGWHEFGSGSDARFEDLSGFVFLHQGACLRWC